MEEVQARVALDHAIRKCGETYASISRLLNRNPAYIQQYVRRGIPRRLDAADLRKIARTLGVDPVQIGANPADIADPVAGPGDLTGPGDYLRVELVGQVTDRPALAFHASWAERVASTRVEALAMVEVEGDSMLPALAPGDQLLVDRDDSHARLRDGIYALRVDGSVIVKRLAINPASRKVTILSDNETYPVWESLDPGHLDVVGRVVWAGRRFL